MPVNTALHLSSNVNRFYFNVTALDMVSRLMQNVNGENQYPRVVELMGTTCGLYQSVLCAVTVSTEATCVLNTPESVFNWMTPNIYVVRH